MKSKTIWLLMAMLAFSSVSQAEPVDKEAAQAKAAQVLNNRKDANARRKAAVADVWLPRLLKTSVPDVGTHPASDTSKEVPTYYVFGNDDDAGFVIIAGDDAVNPVVGYSLSGSFSADNMPDAMRVWLSDYDRYVKAVRSGSRKARNKAGAQEPAMPVVGPWLKTTWNQYGMLTPNNYPAGCVPTAVAQIMYYYQWPKNSYNRIYDWERMVVPYPENGYSYLYNPEAQPIAVLMRDLGYMMGTSYAKNGSSTTINSNTGLTVCGYETEEVKGDLQPYVDQGPVYVSLSGHGVVADGYDSNGLYHINWGWEGINDGYYDITTTMETDNGNYTFASQGHYFLKPVKDKAIVAPIANDIVIDKAEAASGDQINVTLNGLKLASGGSFNGKIALAVYRNMQNGNYFQTQLTFSGATTDTRYRLDSETDWNSSSGVTSLTVSMTLKNLSSNGNFYLVPICYNELDENPEWRPLAQYADGTTQEYISFSHQNGQYTFMPFVENNQKLEFLDILTPGSYVRGGMCETYFSVRHFNRDAFMASIDITLSRQGGGEVHVYPQAVSFLPCPFDNSEVEPIVVGFTRDLKLDIEPGEYRISKIELYNGEGDRRKVLCSWTEGTSYFTVEAPTGKPSPEFLGRARNEVDLTGSFPDNSMYEGAQGEMEIVLKTIDGSTPEVELLLWAISADSGERYLLKTETRALPIGEYHDCYDGTPYSQPFYSNFYYTADVPAGTYTFCLYARCGNSTYILGSGGSAIFHVVAPPANMPKLRLNSLRQEGDFYVGYTGFFNIATAEIENLGQTDYIGSGLKATGESGLKLECVAPFRVRAGQKATVFLKVTSDEEGQVEEKMLNDVNIPLSGSFKLDFKAAPEHTVCQYGVTPYITYVTTNTYPTFPSATGTLERSLWQNGKLVKTLDALTLDGNSKSVISRQDELNTLPVGEYVAKCELTDANGITCTPLYYPVLIDEGVNSLTVTKTALDKRQSSSYDTDIPFFVTFTNNMNKPLSTVIKTEVEREGYYTSSTRYHSVEISAEATQTLSLVTSIGLNGEPDQYTINARFCDNVRDNGHLQFRSYSSSRYAEPFKLPFTVSSLLGDADGDGSLTQADIVAIWGIISEQSNAPAKGSALWKNADANGDNVVNAADIVMIVDILQKE